MLGTLAPSTSAWCLRFLLTAPVCGGSVPSTNHSFREQQQMLYADPSMAQSVSAKVGPCCSRFQSLVACCRLQWPLSQHWAARGFACVWAPPRYPVSSAQPWSNIQNPRPRGCSAMPLHAALGHCPAAFLATLSLAVAVDPRCPPSCSSRCAQLGFAHGLQCLGPHSRPAATTNLPSHALASSPPRLLASPLLPEHPTVCGVRRAPCGAEAGDGPGNRC